MDWIYLALVALVLVFGLGVLVLNRRRSPELSDERTSEIVRPPRPAVEPRPVQTADASTDTAVLDPVVSEAAPGIEAEPVSEPELEPVIEAEPETFERPSFTSRMSKARSALTGAFLGIRSRAGITDSSFDDLEEALLRADVGVRVTDELLGGLRARVKSKEITTPDALLDALRTEMTGRLEGADRELHLVPGEPGSPNVWLFVGVNGVGKTTRSARWAPCSAARVAPC